MNHRGAGLDVWITKGSHVRYDFFAAKHPLSALAGAQLKFSATRHEGTGIVPHIRGCAGAPNAPPTRITFCVQPDDEGPEIEVPQSGIVALL